MFTFLLVVHAIIAALLVAVILMQRSEGGGLTTGGSPSGLMSARGAADFLTRATAVLATLFILMSIGLAFVAASRHSTTIDTSLQRAPTAPVTLPSSAPAAPVSLGNVTAPAASANSSVPLAQ
jgi:preprotein translocase subunit SecG